MISAGDIVVAKLQQADGNQKARPVLLLSQLPGFGDYLVCGISSQIHQEIRGFDLVLSDSLPTFPETGLSVSSVVRLNFLSTLPTKRMTRRLGRVDEQDLSKLLQRLAKHLTR